MPIVLWEEEAGFGSGDPAVSLPGSGVAVPRGVEAVFRYNGLTFNDRSVIDKYRVISIDGLDDPDVRDSRQQRPGSHGEELQNALYGGRTIAIRGRVEAYTLKKLRDMQQALRTAFIDISKEMPLYFLTGDFNTNHYINCKKFSKNQWAEEQRHQNHFFRDFLITLRASDPRFYKVISRTEQIQPETALQDFYGTTVVNEGNFHSEPVIIFRGPLDNFILRNITTGVEFKLKSGESIPENEYYRLNVKDNSFVNKQNINKYGVIDPNYDTNLFLAPGENYFELESLDGITSTSSRIEITYRDSYL